MGSEFSRSEKMEYGQYRNVIDQALRDQEPYVNFMEVRDKLAEELSVNKPNVHRYVVAYAKKIVKSKKVPNHIKFNALLLLKELMKAKYPSMVAYNQKKFMERLRKLAASPDGPNVLLEYNNRSSAADSAKFYQLLLECLNHWGNELGAGHPVYADARNKLVKLGRLPIPEVYYNVPRAVVQSQPWSHPESIPNLRNTLDAFRFERIKIIELLKYKGMDTFDDQEIKDEFKVYENEKRKIDQDPFVQSLLANTASTNPHDQELVRDFGHEIMMYDVLREGYYRTDPQDSAGKQRYFKAVDDTHRNLFGTGVNFTSKQGRDPRFDSPHEDIMMSRDKFSQRASDARASNVYPSNRPEDNANLYESQRNLNGAGNVNQGRPGAFSSNLPTETVAHQPNVIVSYNDSAARPNRNGLEPQNSNFNSRREYAEDVNDLRAFGADQKYQTDRGLGSIREEYDHEIGGWDRDQGQKRADGYTGQAPPSLIPVPVEAEYGRDNGRMAAGQSFERDVGTQKQGKSTEPVPSGKATFAAGGRVGVGAQTDYKDLSERQTFRLNNLKTEPSNRASNRREEEGEIRNPYKAQTMTNSKEFYKAYFNAGGPQSARSAAKEYQFQTEGLRFVNGMYENINHVVARNVY